MYSDEEVWMVINANSINDFVDVYLGENPEKLPLKDRIVRMIRLWHSKSQHKERVERTKIKYAKCKNGNVRAKASANKILIKKK